MHDLNSIHESADYYGSRASPSGLETVMPAPGLGIPSVPLLTPTAVQSDACHVVLQVYPTQVRSFGLGVCNACSRLGALLSPFLTVDLVEHGHPHLAEGTLAACCAIAAGLTWLLPIETKARSLLVRTKSEMQYIAVPAQMLGLAAVGVEHLSPTLVL